MLQSLLSYSKSKTISTIIISLIFIAALVIRIVQIITFGGMGWEHDSYMHFLYANSVFNHFPSLLYLGLGVWPKPIYTFFFAVLMHITHIHNLYLFEVTNTIFWLIGGIFLYKIFVLKKTDQFVALGLLGLYFFSFLGLRSSIGELTEPMATLSLILGYYFYEKKQFSFSAIALSLIPLIRLEATIILGVFYLYMLFGQKSSIKQKVFWLLLLALPTVIWDLLGFLISKKILYIISTGYFSVAQGVYGHGNVFYYLGGLLQYEPIIFPLFLLAVILSVRRLHLAQIIVLLYIIVQTIMWMFGLFGTAGLLRYFVIVLPMFLVGIADVKLSLQKIKPVVPILALVLVVVQAVFSIRLINSNTAGYMLYNTPSVNQELINAGGYIARQFPGSEPVVAASPEVLYYAGRTLRDSNLMSINDVKNPQKKIYVWDGGFGNANELSVLTASRFSEVKAQGFGSFTRIFVSTAQNK